MKSESSVAVLLVLFLVVNEGNTLFGSKWRHGLSANVNDYVDKTVNMLVPFIKNNGLDSIKLPEVVQGFEVKPLLITYSAWLKIYDGYMTGLVNLSRCGDQTVNYFAKMLRVRVQLQFNDLKINYKYLIKVLNLGPTGGIVGTLNHFEVIADVLIDFNNDEIHLQEFSMLNIGRVKLRFTGNILIDWLVNPVITVFLGIIDTIIIKVIELNIYTAIQDGIYFINTNLQNSIKYLESYN